ncbi:MAG: malate:quinone oxidoreductase [Gammaproteobacteria bacterium]|nr:malate:quinone oxidoreductase [Gammaproteobacteria bacterium]
MPLFRLHRGQKFAQLIDALIAALLGASPGASISVSTMLDVIQNCLPDLVQGSALARLQELIPSYGHSLLDDADLVRDVRSCTLQTLGLDDARSKKLSDCTLFLQTGS